MHLTDGRGRLYREGVNRAGQFRGKNIINATLTVDAAQSGEGLGHDLDPKMALPARPCAGMAGMEVRFIDDDKALGQEGGFQLAANGAGHGAGGGCGIRH